MKNTILITIFFALQILLGQEVPQIEVGEKEKAIQLTELTVQTEIVGNISQTTYEMVFYNPNNRILEGELVFPLGEGQIVTGYALDIDGKMREAVVVEKQKARQAFEQVIRQKVDPALLEQSEGNNYKSRIYPLPAKGTRKIKIVFEQELLVKNNRYYFELPLKYKKIQQFDLRIEVFKQESIPVVQNSSMQFERWQENYVLKHNEKDFTADETLQIEIPTDLKGERVLWYDQWFYLNKKIKTASRLKSKPNTISIFWDASLSQQQKDQAKEIDLLKAYLQQLNNVKVKVILFNYQAFDTKTFKIQNGSTQEITKFLSEVVYDGATSFYEKIVEPNLSSENLIFTNGIFNFKKETFSFDQPFYVINSETTANHVENRKIAETSGGRYINLNRFSVEEALQQLVKEPYRFLGYKNNASLEETFPVKGTIVDEDFTFTGKAIRDISEITLLFGYGQEVTVECTVKLNRQGENDLVKRVWAKKKLAELTKDTEANKEKIIEHALSNQLITPYTSLIVLDRLEDYLRYEIVPPAELQKDYFEQIARQKEMQKQEEERVKAIRSAIQREYQEIKEWWVKDFSVEKKKVKSDSLGVLEDDGFIETERRLEMAEPSESPVLEEVVSYSYATQTVQADALEGAVAGVEMEKNAAGNSSVVRLRGINSLHGTSQPLYIVNGKVVSDIRSFSAEDIQSVNILKGNEAMAMYGSRAREGVMMITTKSSVSVPDSIVLAKEEDVKLKRSDDYIAELSKTSNLTEAYQKYIELRKSQEENPLFYIDVADYFYEKGEVKQAFKIISNVLELKLDDPELIRLVAYKLESYVLYREALIVYEKLLELRPEDIQTYRDVALAYENVGEYQKAFDQLVYIIEGQLIKNDTDRRFQGVEQIAFVEATQLLTNHQKAIETSQKIKPLPVDIRIVLDWNHDNVDMDLWVKDPNGEVCKYNHSRTAIGGRISNDMTQGFGPEEFMLKKAIKGTYKIYTNYYGSSSQKLSGPVTVKVTIFKNYGKSNQTKEVKVIRQQEKGESKEILLGEITL